MTIYVAAYRGPQDCVRKMVGEFDRRRRFLVEALEQIEGVSCVQPLGAFYVFPSIKKLGMLSDSYENIEKAVARMDKALEKLRRSAKGQYDDMTVRILYLGWAAFEVTTQEGTRILLDPMLAGNPEDGVAPSPSRLEEFDGVGLILVSHAASDHVGQAFEIMRRSKALLVCDVATKLQAIEAGLLEDRIYAMVSGVQFTFDDVAVKALPVRHQSVAKTRTGYVSAQPLCYLITTANGERIFFGGDTSIHSDFKLYGELYQPHVAMLGVGGVDVHGQSLTELHPDEAALAAKWLGAQVAIPMHYRFQEGEEFVVELERQIPSVKGLILKPGESYSFSLYGELSNTIEERSTCND